MRFSAGGSMASRKIVKKFIFSNCSVDPYAPGEILEGFDPDGAEVSGEAYLSKRALALFKKLGTTPKDEEMVLGVLAVAARPPVFALPPSIAPQAAGRWPQCPDSPPAHPPAPAPPRATTPQHGQPRSTERQTQSARG